MNKKKVIISFFIASLFLSVLIQTSKLVNYALNQDEYIAQFCENKDVPDSNCKGTCHLSKELKLSANNISSQTGEFSVLSVYIFSFQQLTEVKPTLLKLEETEKYFILENHIQEIYINSIFRPPIV